MCHNGHHTEARASPELFHCHKRLTELNRERDEQTLQTLQPQSRKDLRTAVARDPHKHTQTETHTQSA